MEKYFSQHSFSHCINCAAYTSVDKAETEKEMAFQINATAAGELAAVCKKYDTRFIHISTDYVFDGNGSVAHKESDQTGPVNMYGASKLAGEKATIANNEQAVIIRTSWVYSSYGKNFVKTMLRLMSERESIAVVNDQFGCPTYAADLATAILTILSCHKQLIAGIYHYSNKGVTSWYDFALEIKNLTGSKCQVNPISTDGYPTAAKRPPYSVLATEKIQQAFDLTIPDWRDSLKKCIVLLAV